MQIHYLLAPASGGHMYLSILYKIHCTQGLLKFPFLTYTHCTKNKVSIMDFFGKCEQIRRKRWHPFIVVKGLRKRLLLNHLMQ